GGPDGGNGGRGGDVVIVCVSGLNTLIDFRYRQHFKAERGHHGMGKDRTGAGGKDLVIEVPAGTQILSEDKEVVLADVTEVGEHVLLLNGGDGGYGNAHFKSSTNRAPRRADPGHPGTEMWVWLHLKLIADIGLVGLPNAGKSTFIAAVSRARPKIADYPFTTLHPNLGVVRSNDREMVLADVPGLIAGAHEGAGLGTRFLGHVERCGAILHLVDGTAEDVAENYRIVRHELDAYGGELKDKLEVVALNKCDALTDEAASEAREALQAACGKKVYVISGAAGMGVDEVQEVLFSAVEHSRQLELEEKEAGQREEYRP
ncbi:MAG: GTPase ObgE, partial [Rhodospirillaceae bacterium]|nr:GTPase ObgE [Rhodospirillaceae bacterium]